MRFGKTPGMPEPESDELGRYLEDTITIDWQTPSLVSMANQLIEDWIEPEDRVRRLFEFVRDEIDHSIDVETDAQTCRASEVLRERTGICYAKSHLLAAFLRYAGFPAGFCYARTIDENRPERFVLHGFNAVYWTSASNWIYLDAGGGRDGSETECRFEAPWSLSRWPDNQRAETFLPYIYKRPGKRIVDLLERAPDFDAVRKNLPDSI